MLRALTAMLLSRAARTQKVVDAQQATMLQQAKTRRNIAYGFYTGLFASLSLMPVTFYSTWFAADVRFSSTTSPAAFNALSLPLRARAADWAAARAFEPV